MTKNFGWLGGQVRSVRVSGVVVNGNHYGWVGHALAGHGTRLGIGEAGENVTQSGRSMEVAVAWLDILR